jgi:hypothetical protein
VKSGFTKKTEKVPGTNKRRVIPHQGPKEHLNVYADWRIGLDCVAVRRFACSCEACANQINTEWDDNIKDWTKQPRFQRAPNCNKKKILGPHNDWKFVTLGPAKTKDESVLKIQAKEEKAFMDDILAGYDRKTAGSVKKDGYAAMNMEGAPDGYYLIQWTGVPFETQDDKTEVEGFEGPVPKETLVCEGRYLDRIEGSPHWYRCNWKNPRLLFRLQYIVAGEIKMLDYNKETGIVPRNMDCLEDWMKKQAKRDVKRVPPKAVEAIKKEIQARDALDIMEIHWNGREEEDELEWEGQEEEESDDEMEDIPEEEVDSDDDN